jgi:hypothetical protein
MKQLEKWLCSEEAPRQVLLSSCMMVESTALESLNWIVVVTFAGCRAEAEPPAPSRPAETTVVRLALDRNATAR